MKEIDRAVQKVTVCIRSTPGHQFSAWNGKDQHAIHDAANVMVLL